MQNVNSIQYHFRNALYSTGMTDLGDKSLRISLDHTIIRDVKSVDLVLSKE